MPKRRGTYDSRNAPFRSRMGFQDPLEESYEPSGGTADPYENHGSALQPSQFKSPFGNRASRAMTYQDRGYSSISHHDPNQGELLPRGSVEHDITRQPKQIEKGGSDVPWEELDKATRDRVTANMSEKYGLTMRNMKARHGALIDQGFVRSDVQRHMNEGAGAGPSPLVEAEGQRWYHGGPGTQRDEIAQTARAHGSDFTTIAAMRAAISPRSNAFKEQLGVEQSIAHVHEHPESVYTHGAEPGDPGHIGGAAQIQQNLQKSAEIYRQSLRGVHPYDVEVEASGHGERRGMPSLQPSGPNKGQPKVGPALSGGKVTGYGPSYTHPDTARRLAVDVHGVAAIAPHLDKDQRKHLLDEPHAHAFVSHAFQGAAEDRGLSGAEGQTVAWHEFRNYARHGIPTSVGHNPQTPMEGERRLPGF